MNRREKGYLGIALLFSAFVLMTVFIVTCIKKKNILAALAAAAAIDVTAAYWLLRRTQKSNNGYTFDFFDEDSYEVFDDDEVESARSKIHAAFNKRHGAERGIGTVKPAYEIPVDDEATEDDFAK